MSMAMPTNPLSLRERARVRVIKIRALAL